MILNSHITFDSPPRKLGRGAFGHVFLGYDQKLARHVAVKFFEHPDNQLSDQIRRELEPLIKIDHPNVLKVFQLAQLHRPDSTSDTPENAVVMEYFEGCKTFYEVVFEDGVSEKEATSIAKQILDGIRAFHNSNCAHNDLHETNVLIADGKVKIIDPISWAGTAAHSTQRLASKIDFDIRQIKMLLLSLMAAAKDLQTPTISDTQLVDPLSSLEDIAIFLGSSNAFDANRPAKPHIATVIDILENGNRFDIDNLIRETVSQQHVAIRRVDRQISKISTLSESFDAVRELLRRSDLCTLTLLASTSASRNADRALPLIKRLSVVRHTDSEMLEWRRATRALQYLLFYYSGAAAVVSQNTDFLKALLNISFRDSVGRRISLAEDDELSGWPNALGHDCFKAWFFALEQFSTLCSLRHFFGNDETFRSSMCAFSMISTYHFYMSKDKDLESHMSVHATTRTPIPPMFFFMKDGRGDSSICDIAADLLESISGLRGALNEGKRQDRQLNDDRWEEFVHAAAGDWARSGRHFSVHRSISECPIM